MISLRKAKSERIICTLPCDNYQLGNWNIMTDGHTVWLTEQVELRPPKQAIAVPKRVFDRLLTKYEKPQRAALEGK